MAPSATNPALKSASEISLQRPLAFQRQMIAKSLEDPTTSFSKRASRRAFCWAPHRNPEETYKPEYVIEVEYSEWLSDTGLMATAQATSKAEFDALLAQKLASNNNFSAASTTTQPTTDEANAGSVNPLTPPASPLSSLDSTLSSIEGGDENADAYGNVSEDAVDDDSTNAGDSRAEDDENEEDEKDEDEEGDEEDTVTATDPSTAEAASNDSNIMMRDAPAVPPTSADDTMEDLEAKVAIMQTTMVDMANQMAALATQMGEVTKSMAAMKEKADAGDEHSACGDSMSLVDDLGDLKV